MAGEAVLWYELETPIPMTCADGTGIAKGALLELADPMTVTTANGDADYIFGIAAEEKIASDGKTKIPVYVRGVFRMLGEGNITAGQAVMSGVSTGSANAVMAATASATGAKTCGIALETATDGQTLLVYFSPGVNNNAYA